MAPVESDRLYVHRILIDYVLAAIYCLMYLYISLFMGRRKKGNYKRKYTKEVLREAVRHSTSVAGVLRYLGIHSKSGSVWSYVKRYIEEYHLDTSHFTGRGYYIGQYSAFRLTPNEIFRVIDKPYREAAARLRRALIEVGVPYVCSKCGQGDVWQGSSITLEVDHIDGDWRNCLRENLRFMCPNCHSQEPTSKNRRKLIVVVCPDCGIERKLYKAPSDRRCRSCAAKKCNPEKKVWPSNTELERLVWAKPVSSLAIEIGVSGSAIKKRCKQLGIETPPRGFWTSGSPLRGSDGKWAKAG